MVSLVGRTARRSSRLSEPPIVTHAPSGGTLYVGYAKDITDQKNQTKELLEQARHDSLTQLYNNRTGKELIDRYLQAKDPYASCGMLVIEMCIRDRPCTFLHGVFLITAS